MCRLEIATYLLTSEVQTGKKNAHRNRQFGQSELELPWFALGMAATTFPAGRNTLPFALSTCLPNLILDLYPCNQLHLSFSQPRVISSLSHLSKHKGGSSG